MKQFLEQFCQGDLGLALHNLNVDPDFEAVVNQRPIPDEPLGPLLKMYSLSYDKQ